MEPGYILWEAVRTNDADTIKLLLKPSTDTNTNCAKSTLDYVHEGLCPIHLAIINGNVELLQTLLASGVSMSRFQIRHAISYISHENRLIDKLSHDTKFSILSLPLLTDDPHMLRELLKHDPALCSDDKGEVLGVACVLGQLALLHILLDAGGSVYLERCEAYEQFRQQSLLLFAVDDPVNYELVKLLLDRNVSLAGRDKDGNTPVHIAAKYGSGEVVKLFLDALRTKREPVCCVNSNTHSPFHIACHRGHLGVLKILMEHKCGRRCHPQGRKYLLHSAAKAGHANVVHYLLDLGQDVNQLDNFANTPLSQAVVKANNIDITRLLLNAGANPNIPQPPYYSIIISAAQKSSVELVTALLQNGASVNSVDILGYAPISYVSTRRDSPEEFIKILVESGAKVDHRHGDGSTSLHRAVADDNLPAVTSLIQHQADISSRNRIGKQPMHFAVSEESARILLDSGAELDVQDEIGYTPLMSACRHKNTVVGRFLIRQGANINMTTVNGVSPLALAIGHDLTSLVRELVLADVKNLNAPVFGHFSNMLELALCLESNSAICDILHAAGTYIRPTFYEVSPELCPQDYLNIPHCLGVYKPYASLSLNGMSWAEFLTELNMKLDIAKYRSPLSLQLRCGHFLRWHFDNDCRKIRQLPLPETIINGVLLLA
ncbi:ankyrin-1-like [Haliotis rufescens]|uniref:ankyrin-1-like n=1 Tax=Haliotis rufescens TaxID=6454 RepID=UPI00201E84AC|nr:ankyrin-1-like [Haliotis rufescens]